MPCWGARWLTYEILKGELPNNGPYRVHASPLVAGVTVFAIISVLQHHLSMQALWKRWFHGFSHHLVFTALALYSAYLVVYASVNETAGRLPFIATMGLFFVHTIWVAASKWP